MIQHINSSLEKEIFAALKNQMPLSSGSSRCIYDIDVLPAELIAKLGVPNKDVIIKLAVGFGGISQTASEVNAFINSGECLSLAKIYAYSTFLEIMEKVYIDEVEDIIESYEEGDAEDVSVKVNGNMYDINTAEIGAVYEDVCETTGYNSPDNYQIGFSLLTGGLVCYDYGYNADWFSETADYISGKAKSEEVVLLLLNCYLDRLIRGQFNLFRDEADLINNEMPNLIRCAA